MSLHIIILAAGLGKRMHSDTPKVLHELAGKPMLRRVIETAQQLTPDAIHIIYGHGGETLINSLSDLPVNWVLQTEQLGTGHAVYQALSHIPENAEVLILSGDVPLISLGTLQTLIARDKTIRLKLLTASINNPHGLGRILRDQQGALCAIVEEKDASDLQKQIKEVYSGICHARAADLARWLPELRCNNAQRELYLTDIIAMAVQEQQTIGSLCTDDPAEIQGVNDRLQLQQLERVWQQRQAEQLLRQGVQIADAARFDLRGELLCGKDVFIDVNCIFSGRVVLGDGCRIGPGCVLSDVSMDAGSEIMAHSVVEASQAGKNCRIGPFARLRAGTQLADDCRIGNFVETKKAVMGTGSKASHLSYLGDVTMGNRVNIGAGTITCNYDGINKHKTVIEDGVFIGSDTQLIAPVTIGTNATIGAGSTIRKDVPPGELTVMDNRQKTVFGWKRK